MPAYFETGFSVREPMWHGQGLILDEYPTDWADARSKAGITWEPREVTAFKQRPAIDFVTDGELVLPDGGFLAAEGGWVFVPDLDHKFIERDDTGLTLGVRSDEFSTIYHGEDHAQQVGGASMEQIIEAFTEAGSTVRFETAGAAREGRVVWTLFWLDEPYMVPGDDTEHLPMIALLNPHDGSGACKAVNTQVRVVCWNTFQMASAEGERTGRQFTFRHVGDVRERIEEAKAAIAGLRTEAHEYVELAKELTELNANDKAVSAFLSEFLPSPREQGEVVSDRVHENVERARSLFRHIYTESVTTEAVRGTAWGLVQTATEYLDHARAYRSPDSYLGRSILRAEPAKAVALRVAREVCGSR